MLSLSSKSLAIEPNSAAISVNTDTSQLEFWNPACCGRTFTCENYTYCMVTQMMLS